MADGAVIIETDLDAENTYKKLARLENKIDSLNDKIQDKKAERLPMAEEAEKLGGLLDAAKAKLDQLMSSDGTPEAIEAAKEAVDSYQAQWNQTVAEVERYDRIIGRSERELSAAEIRAGDLSKSLAEAGYNADKMQKNVKKADKSAKSFATRMKAVVRSALVFAVITQALSKLRDWVGDVVKVSPEAATAIAKLKGALLTLVQPLVNIIIPAFTTLVNVLTAVVSKLAQVFAVLTGSTLDSSKSAAEALNKQTKALNGTGAAAKKASKSLANFDEINKLSTNNDSGSGGAGTADNGTIAPDFDFDDGLTDQLNAIADAVLLIGAGFALWKISENLPGTLGLIMSKLGLIIALIGTLIVFWNGMTDAWENGVDWLNMAEMIGGVAVAAAVLYKLFGKLGLGISLVVGGAAMMVTAFQDIMKNGASLQNTLLLIAGIVSSGLGFFVLTGSVIPLVIAGIASILVEMLRLTGNLEEFIGYFKGFLGGVVDLLMGFVTLDLERTKKGILAIISNTVNMGLTLVESFINNCIKAINWLIEQLNKIHFEFPDWVPGIGGKSFGLHFDQIAPIKLPRLATGAVIPPNREFLAVLGDQKSGTNIETPLPTMIQAFKQALSEMGYGSQSEAYLMLDDVQLGKVIYRLNKAEGNRVGVNLAEV